MGICCSDDSLHLDSIRYPTYRVMELDAGETSYCFLCSRKLHTDLVFCTHCQMTVGHVACVKHVIKGSKWPRCPRCRTPTPSQ